MSGVVVDQTVDHIEIHPALGITRVGNSPDPKGYFLAPEVPYPLYPKDPPKYKDENNNITRQVARFRLYAYNKAGQVIKEIIPNDPGVVVKWQVHVANKKASWYRFDMAYDVSGCPPTALRNPTYQTPEDRLKLVIDGGIANIDGKAKQTPVEMKGKFFNLPDIYLGELQTDEQGRLLVFPGRGQSGTFTGQDVDIADFANNDGWYDDTCDGPVFAAVQLPGEEKGHVAHAWVSTAPPNYAPDIVTNVTMYDIVYDALQSRYFIDDASKPVSFTEHILPILKQLSETQWVNRGFFAMFGYNAPFDFEFNNELLAKLSYGGDPNATVNPAAQVYSETRDLIYRSIRQPGQGGDKTLWPPTFGDNPATRGPTNPDAYLTVTATQAGWLSKWRDGLFINDFNANPPPPKKFEEIDLQLQPATLTKAALHWCMGGAFHPGCELPWILRLPSMWDGGISVRYNRATNVDATNLGPVYDPTILQANATYPFLAQGPGDITRWMAVPWQTDTASCRSGYDPTYNRYLVTFWPSRVPNQIISEASYSIINSNEHPPADRIAAFHHRDEWLRGLGIDTETDTYSSNYWFQVANMITDWHKQGVILKKPIEHTAPYLPNEVFVETGWDFSTTSATTASKKTVPQALLTKLASAAAEKLKVAAKKPAIEFPSYDEVAKTNRDLFEKWSQQHTTARRDRSRNFTGY